MDMDDIFERINEILESSDYPKEISDISGLEEFLNEEDNSMFEGYDEIAQMYDQIMEGEGIGSEDDFF